MSGSPTRKLMAIDFEIEDRAVRDGVHLVAVTGEIDLFTAPEFKQRMSKPIEDGVASSWSTSPPRRSSTRRASAC